LVLRSAEIVDRPPDGCGVVVEETQSPVAPVAQDPAHPVGLVIVIDLDGRLTSTDDAQPTLLGDHPIDIVCPNAVSLFQVIVPAALSGHPLTLGAP
jgi:hypothetical protein